MPTAPELQAPSTSPAPVSNGTQLLGPPRPFSPYHTGVASWWLYPQATLLPPNVMSTLATTAALMSGWKGLRMTSVTTVRASLPFRPVAVITKMGCPVAVWMGGFFVSS